VNLFFAGCVRDSANNLALNIEAILRIADLPGVDLLRLYIAENDSLDGTRDIVSRFAHHDCRIIPVFFDSLDSEMPIREDRIAFCRDQLLTRIVSNHSEGLYLPIDLDLDIANCLGTESFWESIQFVLSGRCDGVFPSSLPFYYDIHALRAAHWCINSCVKEIKECNPRGTLVNLMCQIRYVSLRQKHYLRLQSQGFIRVDSAFGGIGIYSLDKVIRLGARYSSPDLSNHSLGLCEHVVFNRLFDQLIINPYWLINAPLEHIKFSLLSLPLMAWTIARAAFSDVNRIIDDAVKWALIR